MKLHLLFTGFALNIFIIVSGQGNAVHIQKGDSLFAKQDWQGALKAYELAINHGESTGPISYNRLGFCYLNLGQYDLAIKNMEISLQKNPPAQGLPVIYSRLARAYAYKNQKDKALELLDSAVAHRYVNLPELDTLKEFDAFRKEPRFIQVKERITENLQPCKKDPHAREFDFWVGAWDVYPNGSPHLLVGHSVIEVASGGCMILENWTAIGFPQTGKSMNFIDPANNKWRQVWMGSGGALTEYVNGIYHDSIMEFESTIPSSQGSIKVRFRFFNQGPNQVRQWQESSTDNGKTWTTAYDYIYVRRKG